MKLDEVTYREILKGVAGVESSTKLTKEGFEKVMKRFQDLGFRGLLPDPYQTISKDRLIPQESKDGNNSITMSQLDFISYVMEKLEWDEDHYTSFCKRIIKKPRPNTKRDGQKIIIGLMAVLRQRALKERKRK